MTAPKKAVAASQMQAGKWRPTDDLKLIEACKQTNDVREVFLGQRFSCKVSQNDIEQRWRVLLYHPRVSKLAAQKIQEWTSSSNFDAQNPAGDTPFSAEEERLLAIECDSNFSKTEKNTSSAAISSCPQQSVDAIFRNYRDEFAAGRTIKDVQTHLDNLKKSGLVKLLQTADQEREAKSLEALDDHQTDAKRGRYEVSAESSPFFTAIDMANEAIRQEVETFTRAVAELDLVYSAKQLEEFDSRFFPNSLLIKGIPDIESNNTNKASQANVSAFEADKMVTGESGELLDALTAASEREISRKARAEVVQITKLERQLRVLRRLLRQSTAESAASSSSGTMPTLLTTFEECIKAVFATDFDQSAHLLDKMTNAFVIPLIVSVSKYSTQPALNYAILVFNQPGIDEDCKSNNISRHIFIMRKPNITIGRGSVQAEDDQDNYVDFDVSPFTTDRKVSRKHVEITFEEHDRLFILRNAGSRPIFVNGVVTCTDEQRALPHACVVELCNLQFQFYSNEFYH